MVNAVVFIVFLIPRRGNSRVGILGLWVFIHILNSFFVFQNDIIFPTIPRRGIHHSQMPLIARAYAIRGI